MNLRSENMNLSKKFNLGSDYMNLRCENTNLRSKKINLGGKNMNLGECANQSREQETQSRRREYESRDSYFVSVIFENPLSVPTQISPFISNAIELILLSISPLFFV